MELPQYVIAILTAAFVNCIVGHIVGCAFSAIGLPCPRQA